MTTSADHRRILAGIVLVGLAILGFTGWVVWRAHDHAVAQAHLRAGNLAQAIDHHAARAIEAVGFVLNVVAGRIEAAGEDAGAAAEIHALLRERAAEAPQIDSLVVLDRHGNIRHDSEAFPPPPINLADRPFFSAHAAANGGILISQPFQSRRSGRWIVALSRRLADRDGGFAGVVAASLDLRYFEAFYRDVKPGAEGTAGIVSTGGRLVVREPAAPHGLDMSGSPLFRERLGALPSGSYETVSPIDGLPRLVSHRRVADLPFIVFVSVAKAEALAGWREEALRAGLFAVLLIAVVALMGAFGARQLRQREAAEFLTQGALRKLARQHAVVDTILKTLPDGVQLLDPDLKLVGWNDRFFEILGLDQDAILRAPDPARAMRYALAARGEFGPGDPDGIVAQREDLVRRGQPIYDRRQQRTGRWIEIRGVPVPGQGYLGVLRDVTEEVERIAELREANARLERQAAELAAAAASLDAMRRRAEEACAAAELANRAKSSFLANMSHELRTPLNAINGFSEIIADLRFGPDAIAQYRDYARDIHKSGEHLLGLINTVLDLAKVEAGRMELREETVELAPCLLAALRMIRPAAAAKPLRLSYVPPRAPLRLRADEQKLKQSVLNVLSNAVKFTPAGGAVILSVERRPQEVAILVADTGIGIRAEDQDKVFAPFAQVDSALTRRTEGTGLGMALTRSLIELHGGRVTLDSAVGRGTTVALCLPVDRFEPAPLRAVG